MKLPEPDHELGYTMEFVERILGPRFPDFAKWIFGQTYGLEVDEETGAWTIIVYPIDLKAYLAGRFAPDDPRSGL